MTASSHVKVLEVDLSATQPEQVKDTSNAKAMPKPASLDMVPPLAFQYHQKSATGFKPVETKKLSVPSTATS